MDTCQLKPFVERNTHDIKAFKKTLAELTTTVHMLAEGQKNLGELMHSQVQHNVEIEALKHTSHELNTTLDKLHERINALETYQLTTTAANKARFGLIEKVAQYGPIVIGILLAFVTVDTVLTIKELTL